MSAPELTPSEPTFAFVDRIRLRLATTEGDDEGSKRAFSRIKHRVKNAKTKKYKPVDKNSIRSIKAVPDIDDVIPGCSKYPILELYDPIVPKSKLILRTIVKNLDLPAPTPLKPALTYIYGDPYAPGNFNPYEPEKIVCEGSDVELSAPQEEIAQLLNMERAKLKRHVASKFESILCGSTAEDREDMVTLFRRYDHILSAELARGILYTQNADGYCRQEMRVYALKSLPDGILPKEKFTGRPRAMCDITDYINPTPALCDEGSLNLNIFRSDSDSSPTTEDSDSDKLLEEMGFKPKAPGKKQSYRSLRMGVDERGVYSEAAPYRPGANQRIRLTGGMKYGPYSRAANVKQKSIKLEHTKSIDSYSPKLSAVSVCQRVRSLVGSSKN